MTVHFLLVFSFLPVPNEARRTVTGQLSVSAVASVEAGVVPGVVSTHRNWQLGPVSAFRKNQTSKKVNACAICVLFEAVQLRGIVEFIGS